MHCSYISLDDLKDEAFMNAYIKEAFESDSYYIKSQYLKFKLVDMVKRTNKYYILGETVDDYFKCKVLFVGKTSNKLKEYKNFNVEFESELRCPRGSYDCPAKLLNAANAPLSVEAFKWRLECKNFANEKAKKVEESKVRKDTLTVGSYVKFHRAYRYVSTRTKPKTEEWIYTFEYLGGSKFRPMYTGNYWGSSKLPGWKKIGYDVTYRA